MCQAPKLKEMEAKKDFGSTLGMWATQIKALKLPTAEGALSGLPPPDVVGPDSKLLWRIHGFDYDLEAFVASHPGGELALRLAQGIEGSDLFETYHGHGNSRKAALAVLQRHPRRPAGSTSAATMTGGVELPAQSAFKTDLDAMVKAHFAGRGKLAHKATTAHFASCIALGGVCAVLWYGWACSSWTATLLLPVFTWLMVANIAHDAMHFAWSKSPTVNFFGGYTAVPLISCPITWYYQHVISHHTHVNEVETDVDLQHFKPLRVHEADTKPHSAGDSTPADMLKLFLVGLHLAIGVPLFNSGALDPEMYAPPHPARAAGLPPPPPPHAHPSGRLAPSLTCRHKPVARRP